MSDLSVLQRSSKEELAHTFVNLIKHLTTKSENFWFFTVRDSDWVGHGHLEGSNGLNRLIRTTNEDVLSTLSC
jgi:hypothetical protein